VIEGEDPILISQFAELFGGGRQRVERVAIGVDAGAEETGGMGFAAVGGALEDEDGVGSVGTIGGEEPDEAAVPIGIGGQAEEVDEIGEGVGGRLGMRFGEGQFATALVEEETVCDGDTLGTDFPGLAVVVAVDGDGGGVGLGGDAEAGSGVRVDAVDGTIVGESDGGVEGSFGRDGALPSAGIFIEEELAESGVVDGINEAGAIFGATFLGGPGEGVAVGGGEEGEVGAEVPEAVEVVGPFGLGWGAAGWRGDVVHRGVYVAGRRLARNLLVTG
jgi:hypothetical protein